MNRAPRILLTGKNGQIGYELERSLQGLGQIVALGREQMDLADLEQVRAVIRRIRPDVIINAAAYTKVDQAESEPELALRINGEAPGVMAQEARALGAAMIHYSTDYVFDGNKSAPYTEVDAPAPLNAYGRSKLAGETAVRAAGIPHLIFRTSWVYGMRGKNFLLTVLRLAEQGESLRMVEDQYGAPTWCRTVADATAHVLAQAISAPDTAQWWRERSGVYHLAAQGHTNWHEFATAILAHPSVQAKAAVLPPVFPIAACAYPTAALRPENSVLSCESFKRRFFELPDWKDSLRLCLEP